MTQVQTQGGAGWRRATSADAETVLELMRAFYVEERLVFEEAAQGAALCELLEDERLGAVFLLCEASGGPALGHLVLTWSCSLEFGGRFVLLDELCLAPAARGRGEGRRALEFVAEWARGQGAKALRLEVAHENARARATYTKGGFEAHARDLMTRRLD